MRIGVRSQHLRDTKRSGRTASRAQGVQLRVERTLTPHVVRRRGGRMLGHRDDGIASRREGGPGAGRLRAANDAWRFDVSVKS